MIKKQLPPWEIFFREMVVEAFVPGMQVLDIGGGLRVSSEKGNVIDQKQAWIKPLLEKLTYHMMDPVDTYHPDIVGDIMKMPIADATYDVIVSIAVLEHVPRPWDAMTEMYRVLKPGGSLIMYVPFLFPYHEMLGYYRDYFRFSETAVRSLCEPYRSLKLCSVRGRMETIMHLLPGAIDRLCSPLARWIDARYPGSGKQVSGFYVHAIK